MNDTPSPARNRQPLRVAIAGWNAAPALGYDPRGAIGGLETFACQLATALAARPERRVQFLIRHTRRIRDAQRQGVQLETLVEPLRDVRLAVSRSVQKTADFPWVRVHSWRTPLLWQLPMLVAARLTSWRGGPRERLANYCRQMSPHVWVTLGCSTESAAMIRVAAAARTPSVLWLQSNADLDRRFFTDESFINPYGVKALDARETVRNATYVVCQTAWQQERLTGLRLGPSVVIPNPIDVARWQVSAANSNFAERSHLLWVGRYDRFHKRPLLCLDVARRLPDIPVVMIVSGGEGEVAEEVRQSLPPNVKLVERVPHDRMPHEFARARLFLSTGSSEHEGFPNVLLEAAAAGVPIASFEDFDGFLERSEAGASGDGSLDAVCHIVHKLWTQPAAWRVAAANGPAYVRREHDLSVIVAEFDVLLDHVVTSGPSSHPVA